LFGGQDRCLWANHPAGMRVANFYRFSYFPTSHELVCQTFSSSIRCKITMSLTGLFLCSFLLVHLSINLLMLLPDGGNTFNKWAEFMGTNPVIRTLEVVLIVGLLLHAYQGLSLAVTNRKAREPVSYVIRHSEQNSRWASRNMTTLGLLLLFLGVHMGNF
jgi:succinate dehydrogenase / fumarate reductase cytochrome b subunit